MTEREKLIELMTQAENEELSLLEFEKKILADYLIKKGVIVPPCKVGDTVYSYSKEFGTVLAYFVEQIEISYDADNKFGLWVYEANCVETGDLIDSIDFYYEDIGKTVFLTREEAGKALIKKIKETNNENPYYKSD